MERLAIKWATLEPNEVGSNVKYADAVQAVEEAHRSYGGGQMSDQQERADMWERFARDYADLYRDANKLAHAYRALLSQVLTRLDLEECDHPGEQYPCAAMRDVIREAIRVF